ncbi:alpha/beta fold hydrolase [Asanoa sp. NPDC049518]|uniref:alpha/beta fold hydrolase n=1 Tax=unclassified Asanoa TaxID=2685164 RepID=UPI003413DCAA
MATARMHDDTTIDVSVRGAGPAVLLPVSTTVIEGEAGEQMRAWGVDPALGHTLAAGLAEAGFRVVTADYEGHLTDHPKPATLTADAVAADLLAIADAAGAQRFAYYGYSWLALSGLQLALRTDRLTALVIGGYPPLGGPYDAMRTVTAAAHRMAVANEGREFVQAEPGDWDAAEVTRAPDQTAQYVTLYESLCDFDERAALGKLNLPRLAFAGTDDNITYGPKWNDAYVAIGEPLGRHREELETNGWTVELIPGADHLSAMRPETVLPILTPWLTKQAAG